MEAANAIPIFELLRGEHDQLRELLRIMESERHKGDTFGQLRAEVDRHMQGEEELVYPEIAAAGLKTRILESLEEHHISRMLLEELEDTTDTVESWMPKFTIFRAQLEHHLRQEERHLFPDAGRRISSLRQEEMADQYRRFESTFAHAGTSLPQSELPFYHNI